MKANKNTISGKTVFSSLSLIMLKSILNKMIIAQLKKGEMYL